MNMSPPSDLLDVPLIWPPAITVASILLVCCLMGACLIMAGHRHGRPLFPPYIAIFLLSCGFSVSALAIVLYNSNNDHGDEFFISSLYDGFGQFRSTPVGRLVLPILGFLLGGGLLASIGYCCSARRNKDANHHWGAPVQGRRRTSKLSWEDDLWRPISGGSAEMVWDAERNAWTRRLRDYGTAGNAATG